MATILLHKIELRHKTVTNESGETVAPLTEDEVYGESLYHYYRHLGWHPAEAKAAVARYYESLTDEYLDWLIQ